MERSRYDSFNRPSCDRVARDMSTQPPYQPPTLFREKKMIYWSFEHSSMLTISQGSPTWSSKLMLGVPRMFGWNLVLLMISNMGQ